MFYKVVDSKVIAQAIHPPVSDPPEPGWQELEDTDPLVYEWLNPSPPDPPPISNEVNWQGLYNDLINPALGLPLYQFILIHANSSLPVNTAFTVFTFTLTNTRDQSSLAAALSMLVSALEASGSPLDSTQKALWNSLIERNYLQLPALILEVPPPQQT